MNMHEALALLFYGLAVLAVAIAFWLTCDGLHRLDQRAENRHQRRLDRAADREIRKQFNQITGHHDGIEHP
jgi:hypothetical protein